MEEPDLMARVLTSASGVASLVVVLLYSSVAHPLLRDVWRHPRATLLLLFLLLTAASSLALFISVQSVLASDLLGALGGALLVWSLLAALSIGPWLVATALLAILSAAVTRTITRIGALRLGMALALGVVVGIVTVLVPV